MDPKEIPVTIKTMSRPESTADSGPGGDQPDGDQKELSGDLPPGLVCPSCGSKLIRRSVRRTFRDRLMSLLGKWPYRCQMCSFRFNGPQDAASIARNNAPTPEEEEFLDEDEAQPARETRNK